MLYLIFYILFNVFFQLNLKFEVEVLCNTLSLEMKVSVNFICSIISALLHYFWILIYAICFQEIKASELLKDPERLKLIPHQLSSPEKDKQREWKWV